MATTNESTAIVEFVTIKFDRARTDAVRHTLLQVYPMKGGGGSQSPLALSLRHQPPLPQLMCNAALTRQKHTAMTRLARGNMPHLAWT